MTDTARTLDGLDDRELAYVVARARCTSDTAACRLAGIGHSTFYRWGAERRADLNARALALQRDMSRRVLATFEVAAVQAAERIVALVQHPNPNVALKAAAEVLDRVLGKPTQRQEVAAPDNAPAVIRLVWENETLPEEAGDDDGAL